MREIKTGCEEAKVLGPKVDVGCADSPKAISPMGPHASEPCTSYPGNPEFRTPLVTRLLRAMFGLCFLVVVFSVGVVDMARIANVPLPAWLQMEDRVLNLEGRNVTEAPSLSVQTWMSGEFQTQAENLLSDTSPAHDSTLLANAALQRAAIASSAHLFGYTTYPTFYGSKMLYISEQDRIGKLPYKATDGFAEQLQNAAGVLNDFDRSHPELDVAVLCINDPYLSAYAPTADLVPNPADFAFVRENLLDPLDPSIAVAAHEIPDAKTVSERWYRSDHHWKTEDAYDAYCESIVAMDPQAEPIVATRVVTLEDVDFNGSYARRGLMQLSEPDHVTDIVYDASELHVKTPDAEGGMELLVHADQYASGDYPHGSFVNHYGSYFHYDKPYIEIENPSAPSEDSLLIVGNSYTVPIERFFAENYQHVYHVEYRYYEGDIDAALAAYQPDRVLFVMAEHNYTQEDFLGFMGVETE